MIERRWLTVKETAEYLKLRPQSVYRDCYKGKIPFSRVPGIGLRIDKKALDEQLKNSRENNERIRSVIGDNNG